MKSDTFCNAVRHGLTAETVIGVLEQDGKRKRGIREFGIGPAAILRIGRTLSCLGTSSRPRWNFLLFTPGLFAELAFARISL